MAESSKIQNLTSDNKMSYNNSKHISNIELVMSHTLMEEKRNKLPHLTPLEKELLLELCTKYLHIIENKKIDFISSKEKSKCWEQIATEFSSTTNVSSRSDAQLRKCWDNIKYKAKKGSCETTKQKANTSVVHHDTFLQRVGTALGISNEFESQNFISLVNEVKEDVIVPRNFATLQHEQGTTSKVSRSCKRKIIEEGAPLIDDNESPISDLISEYATEDYEERRKEMELEYVKELHKLRIHQEKELHAIKMQTEKVKLQLQEEKLRYFKELCLLKSESKASDEES